MTVYDIWMIFPWQSVYHRCCCHLDLCIEDQIIHMLSKIWTILINSACFIIFNILYCMCIYIYNMFNHIYTFVVGEEKQITGDIFSQRFRPSKSQRAANWMQPGSTASGAWGIATALLFQVCINKDMVICPLKEGTWTCSRAMKPHIIYIHTEDSSWSRHGDLPNQT